MTRAASPCEPAPSAAPARRAVLGQETLLVLGVSLLSAAVYALLSIVEKSTRPIPLSQQVTTMNNSIVPDRPWLDLAYQLAGIFFPLVVPALLALHLLSRDPGPSAGAVLGLDRRRPVFDVGAGFVLAASVGLPGIGLYLLARWLGVNTTVAPANLVGAWWTVPVLVLAAIANSVLEEVVVVGYLLTRLRQLDWAVPMVVATSALLRGSYHLYQGYGGFVGNAIMGVVFAWFYLKTKRLGPLIVAHALMDIVAFVGYQAIINRS